MQLFADSVTDISSDNRKAEALDIRLHRKTNVTDAVSRLRLGDTSPEALLCHLDETRRLIADMTDWESVCAVPVKSLVIGADIDFYDVSLFNHSGTGNSVYDLIVYTDAGASGETRVTEKRRLRAAALNVTADYGVKVLCRDAGLHSLAGEQQRFTGDPSGFLHQLDLFGILHRNHDYLPCLFASITPSVSAVVSATSS